VASSVPLSGRAWKELGRAGSSRVSEGSPGTRPSLLSALLSGSTKPGWERPCGHGGGFSTTGGFFPGRFNAAGRCLLGPGQTWCSQQASKRLWLCTTNPPKTRKQRPCCFFPAREMTFACFQASLRGQKLSPHSQPDHTRSRAPTCASSQTQRARLTFQTQASKGA